MYLVCLPDGLAWLHTRCESCMIRLQLDLMLRVTRSAYSALDVHSGLCPLVLGVLHKTTKILCHSIAVVLDQAAKRFFKSCFWRGEGAISRRAASNFQTVTRALAKPEIWRGTSCKSQLQAICHL